MELKKIPKAREIIDYFKEADLNQEQKEYLNFHCKRYEFLLKKVNKIITKLKRSSGSKLLRILDIGPSFQTEILRQTLTGAIIDTLGISEEKIGFNSQGEHFYFDLNDCQDKEKWPKIGKYDLIIMAEVIEHLYTSPNLVLSCIKTWLKNGGYLIIQTFNAVSMGKRIKTLIGQHPYEMIRDNRVNPGHFREYTAKEILTVGKKLGLKSISCDFCNYFLKQNNLKRFIYNVTGLFLPKQFKEGITICFQKINE